MINITFTDGELLVYDDNIYEIVFPTNSCLAVVKPRGEYKNYSQYKTTIYPLFNIQEVET